MIIIINKVNDMNFINFMWLKFILKGEFVLFICFVINS